jgi:hypothetical protein
MIKVDKYINLSQLDKEYNGEGLIGTLDDNNNYVEVGLTEFNSGNELELQEVINNHIAVSAEQLAIEKATEEAARLSAKLAIYAKLGLTEEEINTLIS